MSAKLKLADNFACFFGILCHCQYLRLAKLRSLFARASPGLGVRRGIQMSATTAPKYDIHLKVLLGQQDRVDDAVLARTIGYSCIAKLSLYDCALGEDISPHVVQIGFVILYGLYLDDL